MKKNKSKKKQVSWWRKNTAYKLFAIFMLIVFLAPVIVRVAQAVH